MTGVVEMARTKTARMDAERIYKNCMDTGYA